MALHWPFWLAALATIAIAAALSWLIDARVMRLIVGQPQFAGVMLTIAIAFMLRGLVSMAFGPESRNYPTPWSNQNTHIGGVVIADLSLVIVPPPCWSRWCCSGSCADPPRRGPSRPPVAEPAGGLPERHPRQARHLAGWGHRRRHGRVCGLLLAPTALVDIGLWIVVLKAPLAAVVLGGFGSIPGAILGGLILGVIEQFAGSTCPTATRTRWPTWC